MGAHAGHDVEPASNSLIAALEASVRHRRRSSGSTMARFVFDSRISTIG
jgi:hypothetical protein